MEKKVIKLSVHQLVDFLLRKGDIDNRVFNRASMSEGTLLHALYQSKQGDNYISEYHLLDSFNVEGVEFILDGRADGIFKRGNLYYIDEIKTTIIDLKEYREANLEWHLGQAKCYAYMFAKEKNLKQIGVQLTYIRQGKEKDKLYDSYLYNYEELEKDIYALLEEYLNFYNIIFRQKENRNASIECLTFPFDKYRKGQKELAKYAFATINKGGRLFIEAPTGIGKTMSTLFPAIKSMKDDEETKIFYLTAKNSGKLNAHQALKILKDKGLKLTDILITAKEKICFCKDKNACNPEECPFARGYYNKIKDVIKDSLLSFDDFDYPTIISIAKHYEVCPFELELDLSLFSDVIICDYNYMYDPISYMKRYFDEDSSHHIALVDEAHNLVERSRNMYSAKVNLKKVEEARKSLRHIPNKSLKTALGKVIKAFEPYENMEKGEQEIDDVNFELFKTLTRFVEVYQSNNKEHNEDITKELTSLFLDVSRFVRLSELYSDKFMYYINKQDEDIVLNLLCLDASSFLNTMSKRVKAAIYFSATLSPIDYYQRLLGGEESDPCVMLTSPFPQEHLKLLVAPKISTRYKDRANSYNKVAEYIECFVKQKVGNYFIYLPSYEYQENILKVLNLPEEIKIHIQAKDMSDLEREDFLVNFTLDPKETHVGLLIIGGAFGEGIDLVSDRLIGLAIIGTGIGKINYESNKIALYHESQGLNGYNYAYLYPGMNKVMQAVGRLIRSEEDKGVALLMEQRYCTNEYRSLFKKEWDHYEVTFSREEMSKMIQKFFQK